MLFEAWLHISTHLSVQLVTWQSHVHTHCVGEWAEIPNCVQLHCQINQVFLIYQVNGHLLVTPSGILFIIMPDIPLIHACYLYRVLSPSLPLARSLSLWYSSTVARKGGRGGGRGRERARESTQYR